jgi:transcriptional regulator with XRE-family HTH domain
MKLGAYLSKNTLSREEFARLVGVTPQAVWVWLRGGMPSAPHMHKIETVTKKQVTIDDFQKA